MPGERGGDRADHHQKTEQKALIVAERGHHLGDAALYIAEHDHRGGDFLLDDLETVPLIAAVLPGGLQRVADRVLVYGRATKNVAQRIVGRFGLALFHDFPDPLIDIGVGVTGGLGHHAGATQQEVFVPGVFTDFEKLGVDNLTRR